MIGCMDFEFIKYELEPREEICGIVKDKKPGLKPHGREKVLNYAYRHIGAHDI